MNEFLSKVFNNSLKISNGFLYETKQMRLTNERSYESVYSYRHVNLYLHAYNKIVYVYALLRENGTTQRYKFHMEILRHLNVCTWDSDFRIFICFYFVVFLKVFFFEFLYKIIFNFTTTFERTSPFVYLLENSPFHYYC